MFFKSSSSWEVCICHYNSKFATDFKIYKNSCTSGDMQQNLGMCFFCSIFILPTHVYIVSACVYAHCFCLCKWKNKTNKERKKTKKFSHLPKHTLFGQNQGKYHAVLRADSID